MDIADWRRKIDEMDRRLVELLNQRAHAAKQIGQLKKNSDLPIYEPEREKLIFANVRATNQGPLPHHELQHIFERIIDVMRTIQKEEIAPGKKTSGKGAEFDAEADE